MKNVYENLSESIFDLCFFGSEKVIANPEQLIILKNSFDLAMDLYRDHILRFRFLTENKLSINQSIVY